MYSDKYFLSALRARGIAVGEVAEILGVSGETIRRKRKGVTRWRPEDVEALARGCELTQREIDNIFYGGRRCVI